MPTLKRTSRSARHAAIALAAPLALLILGSCGDEPFWRDWELRESQFGTYEVRQQGEGGQWVLVVKRRLDDDRDSVITQAGPWPAEPPVLVEVLPEITPERPARDSLRFVLESTEGADTDQPVCVIRIVHQDGRVLGEHRRPGRCDRAQVTADRGQKLVFVEVGSGQPPGWVLIDFWSGAKLAESTSTPPPNQEVIHVQRLGDHVLVVLRFRDASDIRIQLFGPGGQLLHVFDIPGTFQEAVDNGIDVKAITTVADGTVYNDLVNVVTGDRVRVTGVAQNPLVGQHRKLQHHRLGDQDRFLETVYDPGRNETTVRVLDGAGRIVATRIWPGEFVTARATAQRKVFVVQRPPLLDVFVVDLTTGAEVRSVTSRAAYDPSRPLEIGPDGVASVPVTVDGTASVVAVPTG